jgi:hypothetical protein
MFYWLQVINSLYFHLVFKIKKKVSKKGNCCDFTFIFMFYFQDFASESLTILPNFMRLQFDLMDVKVKWPTAYEHQIDC